MSRTLLDIAYRLVNDPLDATRGRWSRLGAVLGRRALEEALTSFWGGHAPGVENASMRAQLLCLRSYVDEAVSENAAYAYDGLTRACHHHPYELTPTVDELSGWLGDVGELIDHLAPAKAKAP
jgi:hypothetical protein